MLILLHCLAVFPSPFREQDSIQCFSLVFLELNASKGLLGMSELNQPGASAGHRAPLSCMLELKHFAFTFCEQTTAGSQLIALKFI